MKKEINDKEFQIIYAKKGKFKENKYFKPIWTLYDGATINK